jgi:hypothetical protein
LERKNLGAASISSNNKRAVPGSNPLTLNIRASHCSAISIPDYSCCLKNKKNFSKEMTDVIINEEILSTS